MKTKTLPIELKTAKTNLDVFAQTLIELATQDRNVLAMTSDSRGSGRLVPFAEKLPAQLVEVGIAEQNMVGISAGLAASGKKVFVVSPASFLTARGLEQIKNDIAYSDQPVKVVGISAGVSYGALGTTHHSLHDLAVLQAIHNIDIVIPGDNFETQQAVLSAYNHPRPIYLRFGKKPMPENHAPGTQFEIGKARSITPMLPEYDVAFMACGETLPPAYLAHLLLGDIGVTSCVLSIHTICPFDEHTVLETARASKVVISVEEHSVNGGLGSRIASLLMQAGVFRSFRIVGIPNEHTYNGNQTEIFEHYGISPHALAETASRLLDQTNP